MDLGIAGKVALMTGASRGYVFAVARAQQILEEVRRLPAEERIEVLRGVVELVAPLPFPDDEEGLADAIDEVDRAT